MTWLLTADLHLSDNPRDASRFGLFPWLLKQQQKHDVSATYILGDLTERKDRHSAALVNRIVDEMTKLRPPVYLLRGNHDGLDANTPFFRFLNNIKGLLFITEPSAIETGGIMIPHCRDQAEFDAACSRIQPKKPVMLHQLVDGAIGETGRRLSGLSTSLIAAKQPRVVWAGDIHRPQQVGCVTYVGAPFHVRFGDDFTPRVVLYDPSTNTHKDLHYPAPMKWTLTVSDADQILKNEELRAGDQVKLTIELAREEAIEWAAHRARALAACKELGLEICGAVMKIRDGKRRERRRIGGHRPLSHEDTLTQFCKAENVPSNIHMVGAELIKG